MKNNTIIALLLTFFMLLLVLSAAVVFLYQDRRQLKSEVAGLHLDATVVAVQAQQTVADMAVQSAGVAAAATASHNALVNARATQDALGARVATLEAVEAPTAAPTVTPAQPFVTIISPEDGASLPAGEAIEVVAFVAYPAGIGSVDLFVDDEPQDLAPSEGVYRMVTTESPLDLDPGIHTLTVMITGSDNQSSSTAVDFTIIPPPQEDEDRGDQGEESENGS